jgi:PQQ-dependent dehydrogenase (methanol/ethanol family)
MQSVPRCLAASASFVVLLVGCGRAVMVTSPSPVVSVEPAGSGGDWLTYNRTLAGDRFSPLTEIDRTNVAQLKQICAYELPEVTSLQTGPIVIGGTMYFTTDTISYAINGSTCALRWSTVRHSPTPSSLGVNRGLAYMNGRLFRGTSDAHVVAMDAKDGTPLWDVQLDIAGPGVTLPMAPIASNGLVFIGNAGGDIVGVTGHVYALDASDGHTVWRFDAVPASGPARATWNLAPNHPASGAAFWTSFTLDEPNGLLYVPAGNPAPDFDISLRRGGNLYSNSVIALDAAKGNLVAYNQIVKNDSHDWDVDSPPALLTTKSGRAVIASSNKDGVLSVLDRSQLSRATRATNAGTAMPLLWQNPTTTRSNVDTPLSRDHKTHFCPGIQGGTEWNGAAFDPNLNTVYAGAVDWCGSVQLAKDSAAPAPPPGQYWFGSETPLKDILDPPDQAKGWLTAFDADNGAVKWKFAAPKPILAAVTPTAGGIVLTADMGGTLYAFDSSNGNVIWNLATGQSIGGGIVTYMAGGRQLVGVASGMKSPVWPGGAQSSRIVVYGLR